MQGVQARSHLTSDIRPLLPGLLLFAPISVLGNAIGSVLRYPDVGAAVLFPPYAALVAALVVSRRRAWIWYFLADAIAHFATHWPAWPLTWVLLAGAANAARALVAAELLTRLFAEPPRLSSIRPLGVFLLSAVLIAPAVGATIGAANGILHGVSRSYWHPWIGWFLSNALTGLTMLPAFIVLFAHAVGIDRSTLRRERVIEAVALAFALGAASAFSFLSRPEEGLHILPLYAPLPVLMWAALRFGSAGASAVLTVITITAIWSVDRGTGPFVAGQLEANILALQIFVLFTAVPVLGLAAIASARQNVVQLHQALLASMQDQVAILDAAGAVIEVNDSWQRFSARSCVTWFHRVRAGDDYVTACRHAADQGDTTAAGLLSGVRSVLGRTQRRFEIEYDDACDGVHETHTMSVEALEREDGGAVVRRSNVTERRQAQQEIEEQRRELSHLARVAVLGHLSGAFAHELNQPLSAILSNAETAREILRRRPPDLDYLGVLLRDIIADDSRAAAVMQRLRAMLKRGDRRVQLVETREMIAEVLELAHTELITRHVETSTMVSPALPPIWGDKIQLQQVLLNLILNGCEAMTATPVTRRRLELMADHDDPGSVHIAIRDAGSGILPALIDRLFEPFVTTKADGLGLGLSISRTIVAAHGGRLWGENNPEGGATLHCVLPIGPPSRVPAPTEPASALAVSGEPVV